MSDKIDELATQIDAQIIRNHKSTVLVVNPDHLKEACKLIVEAGFYHLSTITGIDEGPSISVFYHFWQGKQFLSVKIAVSKENPVIPSQSDIIPAALLYEAEVKDLLGVVFQGNQMMDRKLLLPDSYPPGAPPPLRKEADPEKIRRMMELE